MVHRRSKIKKVDIAPELAVYVAPVSKTSDNGKPVNDLKPLLVKAKKQCRQITKNLNANSNKKAHIHIKAGATNKPSEKRQNCANGAHNSIKRKRESLKEFPRKRKKRKSTVTICAKEVREKIVTRSTRQFAKNNLTDIAPFVLSSGNGSASNSPIRRRSRFPKRKLAKSPPVRLFSDSESDNRDFICDDFTINSDDSSSPLPVSSNLIINLRETQVQKCNEGTGVPQVSSNAVSYDSDDEIVCLGTFKSHDSPKVDNCPKILDHEDDVVLICIVSPKNIPLKIDCFFNSMCDVCCRVSASFCVKCLLPVCNFKFCYEKHSGRHELWR